MKTLLFSIATLLSVATFAQTSYSLTAYSSAYEELTNSIPVEFLEDEGHWDDPTFIIPFGFDFQIGDQTYNSSMQFGSGAMMGFGDFFNPGTTSITFFGLTDDFADGATLEGLDSSIISYQIVGNTGNKIAKIQYKNAAFYEEIDSPEAAAENRMDFQLWFYELDGIMEVHYGNFNVPDPELVFYGNVGPSTALAINYGLISETLDYGAAIVGSPENPTLVSFTAVPDDEFEVSLNAMPVSGQVHRLTPGSSVGILDVKAPEFSIYPTLAQSEIWVKDARQANATYRILDITGKEVKIGKLETNNSINVSNLNAGVYLMSIDGMGNAAKFIKQ